MASVDETVKAYNTASYNQTARGDELIRVVYRLVGDRITLRGTARQLVNTAKDESLPAEERLRRIIETLNIAILETE